MKNIIITDPCYTDDGKEDLRGDLCVKIQVSDEFYEKLKLEPIVVFNENDNWDGGTYFFGGKLPADQYEYVGYHGNDAGLTCIADEDRLEPFEWSEFLEKDDGWWPTSHKMYTCTACKGTGDKDDSDDLSNSVLEMLGNIKDEGLKRKLKEELNIDEMRIEEMARIFSRCSSCHGKGEIQGSDLGATMNDNGHFLMVGSTFLGDVGASVWVHKENGEITALAIDVVGYTFGNEDDEEDVAD